MGIKRQLTTAYHPQCDGMLERFHRTLQAIMSKMELADDFWDEQLPLALYAYRTSIHQSTSEAPYYLMFGKDAPTLTELPDTTDDILTTKGGVGLEYRARLTKTVAEARRHAAMKNKEAQEIQKRHYDATTKGFTCYLPGDRVYLHSPESLWEKVQSSISRGQDLSG